MHNGTGQHNLSMTGSAAAYPEYHPTNSSYGNVDADSSRYSSNQRTANELEESARRHNDSRLMSLVKEEARKNNEEYSSGGKANPLNSSSSSLAGSISHYDMLY